MVDEKQVEEFIKENRPLIEDPDTGESTLQRVYAQASKLYTSLAEEATRAATEAAEAADMLTEAINDRELPGSVMDMRERTYNVLVSEYNHYVDLSARMEKLVAEAERAMKAKQDLQINSNDQPKEEQVNANKPQSPAWVGLVALAMVCLTILGIVYLLLTYWG